LASAAGSFFSSDCGLVARPRFRFLGVAAQTMATLNQSGACWAQTPPPWHGQSMQFNQVCTGPGCQRTPQNCFMPRYEVEKKQHVSARAYKLRLTRVPPCCRHCLGCLGFVYVILCCNRPATPEHSMPKQVCMNQASTRPQARWHPLALAQHLGGGLAARFSGTRLWNVTQTMLASRVMISMPAAGSDFRAWSCQTSGKQQVWK
jgi:hypothetical protein